MDPPTLIRASKALIGKPKWLHQSRNNLSLVGQVEVQGVVIEGAQIRMNAIWPRPNESVTFQLEYRRPRQKYRPLCRVDWRPVSGHNNRGLGPAGYRFIEQKGSHYHRFDLNWLELNGEMRSGNLPIALPIAPDPPTFESLLDFIESALTINVMGSIDPPPWEGAFL